MNECILEVDPSSLFNVAFSLWVTVMALVLYVVGIILNKIGKELPSAKVTFYSKGCYLFCSFLLLANLGALCLSIAMSQLVGSSFLNTILVSGIILLAPLAVILVIEMINLDDMGRRISPFFSATMMFVLNILFWLTYLTIFLKSCPTPFPVIMQLFLDLL